MRIVYTPSRTPGSARPESIVFDTIDSMREGMRAMYGDACIVSDFEKCATRGSVVIRSVSRVWRNQENIDLCRRLGTRELVLGYVVLHHDEAKP